MDDLPIRLAKALAPKPPNENVTTPLDRSLAAQYASACIALRKQERFKCQSILFDLQVRHALSPSSSSSSHHPPSAYRTHLLCKVLLLSATFDHKLTGLDALKKMHRHLFELRRQQTSEEGAGKLPGVAEGELEELEELKVEMETRLLKEREVECVKETRLRYGTTVWEVRMTKGWLEQTAGTTER
ncbi:MAG: hypothetical protein Q9211_000948 [Gyalolechia sp. 1 TL-2023]